MRTAKDIMTTDITSVQEGATIEELARLFVEKGVSSMPVLGDDNSLVGQINESILVEQNRPVHLPKVVSIFDWVLYIGGEKNFEDEVNRITAGTVGEICLKPAISCAPDTPVNQIAELMAEHAVHLVSVVEDEKLVGVVARLDLIKNMYA